MRIGVLLRALKKFGDSICCFRLSLSFARTKRSSLFLLSSKGGGWVSSLHDGSNLGCNSCASIGGLERLERALCGLGLALRDGGDSDILDAASVLVVVMLVVVLMVLMLMMLVMLVVLLLVPECRLIIITIVIVVVLVLVLVIGACWCGGLALLFCCGDLEGFLSRGGGSSSSRSFLCGDQGGKSQRCEQCYVEPHYC
ncbi:MAG: hypothetical protein J3R72DRAFT_443389 [Linnemannia gamsii]|nr:MAG: hypothetical protein J3R72DRAFT_443389 [Linnemannia gamsii]